MSQHKRKPRQVQIRTGLNTFDRPPKISVIVTAGSVNGSAAETIEAVLGQKFREYETIVALDGSPASTELERAAAPHIENLVVVKQRGGTEESVRFAALGHARGELAGFVRSGDVWNADFLARQSINLLRGGYDLVHCDAALAGANSVYRRSFMETHASVGAADFASLLHRESSLLMSSVVVRRECLETASMRAMGDCASSERLMWLEIAGGGAKFGYDERRMLRYREPQQTKEQVDTEESEREILCALLEGTALVEPNRSMTEIRLSRIDSRIAEKRGISLLRNGDHAEAINCLVDAARCEPTFKLTAVTWLARVAPRAALYLANSGKANDSSATQPFRH